MKKFIKKTWIYWLALILTELMVLAIVIGLDYAISNNMPEIHQTIQIGNYTFDFELLYILLAFTTIVNSINFLIYTLLKYLFNKILNEYKIYKDETNNKRNRS